MSVSIDWFFWSLLEFFCSLVLLKSVEFVVWFFSDLHKFAHSLLLRSLYIIISLSVCSLVLLKSSWVLLESGSYEVCVSLQPGSHEAFMSVCTWLLQEYGITAEEKLHIAQNYCSPFLRKIRSDFLQVINSSAEDSTTRLDSRYSFKSTAGFFV